MADPDEQRGIELEVEERYPIQLGLPQIGQLFQNLFVETAVSTVNAVYNRLNYKQDIVNNLPDILFDTEDRECSICLVNFKKNEMGKELACHHAFHAPCILSWFFRTISCPYCRCEVEVHEELKRQNDQFDEQMRSLISMCLWQGQSRS